MTTIGVMYPDDYNRLYAPAIDKGGAWHVDFVLRSQAEHPIQKLVYAASPRYPSGKDANKLTSYLT